MEWLAMPDANLTSTDQAAAEIQAATTQIWADDDAQNRCVATHRMTSPSGVLTVRCDGVAGHGGGRHRGHHAGRPVNWTDAR